MTKEQIDFLTEFKRQAIRYAVTYIIASIVTLAAFVWNTSTEIALIKNNQEQIKEQIKEMKVQVQSIYNMHVKP